MSLIYKQISNFLKLIKSAGIFAQNKISTAKVQTIIVFYKCISRFGFGYFTLNVFSGG